MLIYLSMTGAPRALVPATACALLQSCGTLKISCKFQRSHVWKQMVLIFGSFGQMFHKLAVRGFNKLLEYQLGTGGRVGEILTTGCWTRALTQTHGCLRASWAVILFAGLIVSIWLIRFFASGVTVSHSGEGN